MMMIGADNPADTLAGARAPALWIGRALTLWRRHRAFARTRRTLAELSDATLRDIGLLRWETGPAAIRRRLTRGLTHRLTRPLA